MSEHPIDSLMEIAMNNIQDMIDINTIIGEPIYVSENISIIPISKVSFGFVAGGSEFQKEAIEEYKKKDKEEEITYTNPFGGGSGAGVNITPVSFMIINNGNIKLIPVEYCSTIDKIVDYIPEVFSKIESVIKCKKEEIDTEQNYSYTYSSKNKNDDE